MDPHSLAPWRDLALLLLCIEAAAIVAAPGVAFFFAVKGVRWVKKKIRPPLSQGKVWARRIEQGTTKATDKVAGVPIGIASTATRITTTARGIFDYVIGR